ncbi:MAG: PAS domain S-box protein, partial [Planctomycetaceae bacterium]|nr:PAS domain S-box protein [Planctomycetaceae bacterium]
VQYARNLMQAILENVVDVICRVDCEGRVQYVNRVRHGISREEVLSSSIFDWLRGEEQEKLRGAFQRVIQDGEPFEMEFPVKIRTGHCIIYAIRSGPIRHEDRIVGATIVGTDVTQIRQLEATARARQEELLHISRLSLVGQTSSQLAHELKQPLLAIGATATGCLNFLNSGSIDMDQLKLHLKKISNLAYEAREIISNTKRFIQKRPLLKERISIAELVRLSVELVGWEFQKSDIRIQQRIPADLPEVFVDPTQIQQVFVNLLVNAREAIDASSKQEIRHSVVISATQTRPSHITVRISDSGDGLQNITPEELFEAFRTTKPDGTGMGLAICRGIMENHIGELRLAETSQELTAFEVDLPLFISHSMEFSDGSGLESTAQKKSRIAST